MNTKTEQLFFHWILSNPDLFKHVYGHYFENTGIRFIYDCIKNEYMSSIDKVIPSNKEIIALVKMYDKKNEIEIDFIKGLLKFDLTQYRSEFVTPRIFSWIKSNALLNGLLNSFESIKSVDKINADEVDTIISNIRTEIDKGLNVKLEKQNIGLDFDDVDAHDQDTEHNKITTGFERLDHILNGGWDRKTLNILMGAPGSGKSIWGQNLCVNAVNAGYNVAYITLELSDKKALKRIGSMRLQIPINQYDELSKDKEYIKQKIEEVNSTNKDAIFESVKPGKLFIKEYPSGSATISDIDSYCQLIKDETGIDIDFLCVDYIQIMGTEKGVDRNMLYLKGEHLAVGLRALAQKRDLTCLTMTQLDKSKYGANDVNLNDMPESKAMADTADTVWAIIQTVPMKAEGIYHLKHVKLRDNATDYERLGFKFNKSYLRLYDDWFIESIL